MLQSMIETLQHHPGHIMLCHQVLDDPHDQVVKSMALVAPQEGIRMMNKAISHMFVLQNTMYHHHHNRNQLQGDSWAY